MHKGENLMNIIHRNNVETLPGGGPTLLYAHGFGCNKNMWDAITPAFKNQYKQVLFDYVGNGASDLSAFDINKYSSIDGYAQDIIDVCDELNLKNDVILVAHSVSCSAGIVASLKRPDLFRAMILIGPSPCFINQLPDYQGGFEKSDLEELLSLMDQNYIGWANYLAPVVAGDNTAVAGKLENSFCSTDPITAKTFAQTTFFADNRQDYAKADCPSLVLQHKEDTLAPISVGEFVHRSLVNSEYNVLDVKGHCAHMSHPDMVIDEMRKYFKRIKIDD